MGSTRSSRVINLINQTSLSKEQKDEINNYVLFRRHQLTTPTQTEATLQQMFNIYHINPELQKTILNVTNFDKNPINDQDIPDITYQYHGSNTNIYHNLEFDAPGYSGEFQNGTYPGFVSRYIYCAKHISCQQSIESKE